MRHGHSKSGGVPGKTEARETLFHSPARLLFIIALAIFVIEAGLMLVLYALPHLSRPVETLIDAGALTVLLLPFLYLFLFRPLSLHIETLHRVEEALRGERDYLETQMQNRTAELIGRSRELADNEAHYRAVVEGAMEGILTLDRQGRIVRINAAAERMFGYGHEEAVGMPFAKLLTAVSATQCFESNGTLRTASAIALQGQQRSGESLPVQLSLSSFMHDGEQFFTAIIQNNSDRVMFEKRLARLAYYDSLTGLPNRRLFHDRLDQALSRARRAEKLVAIMFLDLDHFKDINDTLGHHAGDALLQEVGRRLTELVRREDTVARLGGDEFTVVLENFRIVEEAENVARKILHALGKPFQIGDQEVFVTVSIGITFYPLDDNDIENLIMNADGAMYQAKAHGRNTFELYTAKLRTEAAQRLAMDTALRKAVASADFLLHYQPEFLLHYQPEIDRYSGEVVGVEALVRWRHPELGLLGPDSFIPLSEETGLIIALGEWVLRNACRQAAHWRTSGMPSFSIAVNVSALQLQDPEVAAKIARILEETGLEGRYLELELTESMILDKSTEFIATLRAIQALGVTLTIDDFGTGHSSLANLQLLPVGKVKIDRSFVSDVTSNAHDAAIAVGVIEMAHKLGIKVVAEGVETKEQLAFLYRNHCDIMQGFHFSRPMPADEFEALLMSGAEMEASVPAAEDVPVPGPGKE